MKDIIFILFVHWAADFILQTDKMATLKSTSFAWLSRHVGVYTLFLFPLGPKYAVINGISHFMIDAVTSRATSYFWKKGERHKFFVVIGFDQFLHTAILIWTMPLLGWDFLF